jgi:hypothetical protein
VSDGLTITPAARLAELRTAFRKLVPRRKLGREGWRHLAHAANCQQVAELAVIERAAGRRHDRSLIETLKIEIRRHLVLAGAQLKGQKP